MKKVYDIMRLPFGDNRFEESCMATCKSRYMAQCLIKTYSNWHTYRIVEREVQ